MKQRDPQKAVRAGKFERTLEQFNVEQGQKMAQTLMVFHQSFVKPLEERIAALEAMVVMPDDD